MEERAPHKRWVVRSFLTESTNFMAKKKKEFVPFVLTPEEQVVVNGLVDKLQARLEAQELTNCPTCGQLCAEYRRKLNKEMARFIILIVRRYERTKNWVHVREVLNSDTFASSNGTMLAHWGMLVHKPKDPKDKKHKTSGYWKPTQLAIDFVHGRVTVPAYIKIYDGTVTEHSAEQISIREALGVEFNYEELMSE